MFSRIRLALRLLAAVERLQDKLRETGTPYNASIVFDRDTLNFTLTWNRQTATGWPLAEAISRVAED